MLWTSLSPSINVSSWFTRASYATPAADWSVLPGGRGEERRGEERRGEERRGEEGREKEEKRKGRENREEGWRNHISCSP